MSDFTLTNEADALLCVLYASYKEKHKSMSSFKARICGDINEVQNLVNHQFAVEDTLDYCYELRDNGLMVLVDADNSFVQSQLTIEAVAFMQNRTKNEIARIVNTCFSVLPAVLKMLFMN